MLYKESKFGRKYIQMVTGSPKLFLFFVVLGVGLFTLLTLTTKIDIIKNYSAEVISLKNDTALLVKASDISPGSAYIYLNKNEAVYPVKIEETERLEDEIILYFDSQSQKNIKLLSEQNIYIDIPQGKITLLYHIFVNGGKRRG